MPTSRDERDLQTRRRVAKHAEEWRTTAAALPLPGGQRHRP
ncbi:hypothetical protein [Amycolatopsis sp. NPDC004169]